jgi:hypothetical protein
MDRHLENAASKRPLRDRIRHLGDEVATLHNAIQDELDWRAKLHPIDVDDCEEDEEAV